MKFKVSGVLAIAVIIFNFSTAHSATYKVGQESSSISFVAKGRPAFLKVKGESKAVTGNVKVQGESENATGTISLKVDTLKTGIELRDDHMVNKYLEVGKYPEAKVSFNNVPLKAGTEVLVDLDLHGQTKTVPFKLSELIKSDKALVLKGTLALNISDFRIEVPSYQGITIAKDIDLDVLVSLDKLAE